MSGSHPLEARRCASGTFKTAAGGRSLPAEHLELELTEKGEIMQRRVIAALKRLERWRGAGGQAFIE